jgi:hypothetical protein
MQDTSRNARLVMAALAALVGLFLIAAEPWIVQTSLERVLQALQETIVDSPKFASGITLFSFFYPFWRAVGFVAGVTLLVTAIPLYRGESWAFPTGMTALAVPSLSGMFMFLPYISFVGGFPLPMVISWVGLIGFWGFLLLRKSSGAQKAVDLLTFTFIGMLATHSFVLGIGAQRMLMTRPEKPLFAGLEWWILTVTGEVDWIATLLLFVSIPLLAMRKRAGWLVAFVAALSVFLIDTFTQIIRTKTLDYLYGSILAAAVLVFLLLPAFRKRLVKEKASDDSLRAASES